MAIVPQSSTALIFGSGGPTAGPVNNSVSTAFSKLNLMGFKNIIGARHALEGVLKEEFYDLKAQPGAIWGGIEKTTGMALGSYRKEPTPKQCQQFLEICKKYDVHAAIFIGGDNTARTAFLIDALAKQSGYELVCIHVPKTIDNDIKTGLVLGFNFDPGSPTANRYVANVVAGIDADNRTMRGVQILVTMGKNAGYIAASSMLAKTREDEGPHWVFTPEKEFLYPDFFSVIDNSLSKYDRAVIVLAEGVRVAAEDGKLVSLFEKLMNEEQARERVFTKLLKHVSKEKLRELIGDADLKILNSISARTTEIVSDGYDGITFSTSGILADHLKNQVENKMHGVRTRGSHFGFEERSFPDYATEVDLAGARIATEEGVRRIPMGESGSVVLTSYDGKRLETVFVPLEVVGNNGTRSLPSAFLSTDGCGISEEFRKYAIPLIGEHNITKRAYLEPKFFSLKND